MPGLVPGIHVFATHGVEDVDGRDEPGHDGAKESSARCDKHARQRGQGTAKDEIGGRSQNATDIVVVHAEPGVALVAKQSARPSAGMIVVEAKPLSGQLAADFAHATLAGQHCVIIYRGSVGDFATLPIAGSLTCAMSSRNCGSEFEFALPAGAIGRELPCAILRVLGISLPSPFVYFLLLLFCSEFIGAGSFG